MRHLEDIGLEAEISALMGVRQDRFGLLVAGEEEAERAEGQVRLRRSPPC